MRTYAIEPLTKPVSAIGLGTMIFHPDTKERDFALLDAFVSGGGTYVDTAEVYGAVEEHGYSEMVIGDWLQANPAMREKILLTSKGLIPGYCAPLHAGGATIDPASIHRAIDGSLQRLKSSYLDVWMFHRDDLAQPVGPLVEALSEELEQGRIRAYGASNWSVARIQEANAYAAAGGRAGMICASPNFSLAKANEPFWPDTQVASAEDCRWFAQQQLLVVAWSALGRGFFAKGDPADTSDADLVRVFYSDDNFARKARAQELARHRDVTMYEVALGYVLSQDFPVVALNGAESAAQLATSLRAGSLQLSRAERDWLDLASGERPF